MGTPPIDHQFAKPPGDDVNSPSNPALVRTIFDQPDAAEVAAQFGRVADALEAKLPAAAAHLSAAEADLLAFTAVPGRPGARSGPPRPRPRWRG
jgi:mutator family transposase